MGGTHGPAGGRIAISEADRRVRVTIGGVTVADSVRARLLSEGGLPPRYYLPREDVRMDLLTPSDTTTTCPWKGRARYWKATVGGAEHADVVWSYPDPIPEAAAIAGWLCFYNERVELRLSGL